MKYNTSVVLQYWNACGIDTSECMPEHRFHDVRKWRFDFGFIRSKVYIEVQGGIWIRGGHNRGAQMKKDWEKYNEATAMGWRPLFCEPKDLCTLDFAEALKKALLTP